MNATDKLAIQRDGVQWFAWMRPHDATNPPSLPVAVRFCDDNGPRECVTRDICGNVCGRTAFCEVRSRTCVCADGYSNPPLCDRAADSMCPNNCGNHGKCVEQSCQCDDGYSGLDCSLAGSDALGAAFTAVLIVACSLLLVMILCVVFIVLKRRRAKESVLVLRSRPDADTQLADESSSTTESDF